MRTEIWIISELEVEDVAVDAILFWNELHTETRANAALY